MSSKNTKDNKRKGENLKEDEIKLKKWGNGSSTKKSGPDPDEARK
jgi:hypothetical protein